MVTDIDIVKLQIRIATGEPLPFAQQDVTIRGHALECRIYAEDPDNDCFPSPGKITNLSVPSGPGIRVDDGIYSGWTVPNEYDPLLGKLIVWDGSRMEAIARMQRALSEYHAGGIKTNVSLFHRILKSRDFQDGAIYTRWLDDFLRMAREEPGMAISKRDGVAPDTEDAAIVATALWLASQSRGSGKSSPAESVKPSSEWKLEGRRQQLDRVPKR